MGHDDEAETISVVFLARAMAVRQVTENANVSSAGEQERNIQEHDRIAKVTVYVEGPPVCATIVASSMLPSNHSRYYAVLETENGTLIMTERLADGRVTFEVNAADLEQRNSFAKAVRSVACHGAGVSVGHVKRYRYS